MDDEYFKIVFDNMQTGLIAITPDYSTICVRIMAHLNPEIVHNGDLLPLVGRRFTIGSIEPNVLHYEIRKTEGVVGYPERMAVMATAIQLHPRTNLAEHL